MRLIGLYRWPLKSAQGEAVDRLPVGRDGLVGDRVLLVVDTAGRMVTQRTHPALARLGVRLQSDGVVLAWGDERWEGPIPTDGARREVVVWRFEGAAVDLGDAAADWLSARLETAVRLVARAPDHFREASVTHAPPGYGLVFADGYPALVLGSATVAHLGALAGRALDARTFRPNLLVETTTAYEEEGWRVLDVGGVEVRLVKPCVRCRMVDVDPDTGAPGVQGVLGALARDRGADQLVAGVNAVVAPGLLVRGAWVRVVEAERAPGPPPG